MKERQAAQAVVEKTARLRALRLVKEAVERTSRLESSPQIWGAKAFGDVPNR
jgi:hypothetical protein